MKIKVSKARRSLTASVLGSVGSSPLYGAVERQPSSSFPLASTNIDIGVCTHFAQDQGVPSYWLPLLVKNGWRSIRDEIYWDHVEDENGDLRIPLHVRNYLRACKSVGAKVFLVLGYSHRKYKSVKPIDKEVLRAYCRYVDFVTSTLGREVSVFEVWNEWDIEIGGSPGADEWSYKKLLDVVVPIIRRNAPNALIVGCGATPESVNKGYLKRSQAIGSFDLLDGISIHPYVYSNRVNNEATHCRKWVENLATSLRVNGKSPLLYVTEVGWPTHHAGLLSRAVDERQQAKLLKDTVNLLSELEYVKGIWWYTLFDSHGNKNDPETSFGMVRTDQTAKPSFFRLSK